MSDTMLNPFATDAFSMVALTLSINKIPNMYGRLNELNLMPEDGVTTRTIAIEEQNNILNLLPTRPVGSPGTQGTIGKRKVRTFNIPHIPHDDVVLPAEVQGIRAFGTTNNETALSDLMARKLQTMRNKHAITLEHLRCGALKGQILDSDGSTIYNLFTEFGIAEKVIGFALGNANTPVITVCLSVKRWIETHLFGEVMDHVHALCSPAFYDALTTHPNVTEAFKYYQQTQNLSGDFRKGFTFGGIVFEEYIGQAVDAAGNVHLFIPDGDARFFPVGTQTAFRTYFAPADFIETVNTSGLALYAKQELRDFARGWDLHTQSNPLPLCTRPEILVRGTVA